MSLSTRISTFLSLGCAIHCIILPLAITVVPLLGEVAHTWWHTYLEPFEAPTLILVVFLTGRQVLPNWSPKKLTSLILLILGAIFVGIVINQESYLESISLLLVALVARSRFH